MARNAIRCIRKGSAQWNEDDRMALANLLIKAGYAVRIIYQQVPGQRDDNKKARMEYVVEYWEE